MYSLLIVDDEPGHRCQLAAMLRELRPCYKIEEARNGKAALEFINTNSVDIVITDIKMPVMDGLQLIENLGPKLKELKVIILSSYGQFEYAQKAIKLGAFDYLLKPFSDENLIEVLKKAEEVLEAEASLLNERLSLKSQLDNTFPVYLESQLNKWVRGSLQGEKLAEIEKIFPFRGTGTVIITEMLNFNEIYAQYTEVQVNEVLQNIKYRIKEVVNPVGHSISFFFNESHRIMITVINSLEEFDICTDKWQRCFTGFLNNLSSYYGIKAIMAIGNMSSNILDEIHEVFSNSQKALNFKFYFEEKNIFIHSEFHGNNTLPFIKLKEDEEELEEAIRNGKSEAALKKIELISGKLLSNGYPSPSIYIQTMIGIVANQFKKAQNKYVEEHLEKIACKISQDLPQLPCLNSFINAVKRLVIQLIDIVNEQRDKRHDTILQKCLEYIEKNYMQGISLEQVAGVFHFNTNYFSSLFKNYTGMNFSDYLLKLRLERGKVLLLETSLKVYEIAEKVGYKDPKYFNKVFKNVFGMTPEEYRRLYTKEVP